MPGNAEDFLEDLIERVAERTAARVAERLPQLPPPSPAPAEYLTTVQAAKLLGLGKSTLENFRARGKGPAFVKLPGAGGAVRYARAELEAWLAKHRRGTR